MSFIDKASFRKLALKRLRFLSKNTKIKKNKNICLEIKKVIDLYQPRKILLYLPLSLEVDVMPLITELRKRKNIEVYFPFMRGKSFVPVRFRYPLQRKRFGIREPHFSVFRNYEKRIDMVIVPIVGIDSTFRRIGFGAGMYDRFFERLEKKPITIFTQLKLCMSKKIVTDTHDIRADYIITM